MALVKSKFKGKGKGKTGDKDNGQQKQQANAKTSPMDVDEPVCFECKEPMRLCGHSAKDCRVRKARVAAGGPERLPNGQRSSGKGSGTWPTRQMWSNFYPGPTQAQWKSWNPQPPQAPSGKINLFEQPHQLSSMTPLQALLAGPTTYSLKPVAKEKQVPEKFKVSGQVAPNFKHKNRYDALGSGDTKGSPLSVNLLDAVKAPSRNQQRKQAKEAAATSRPTTPQDTTTITTTTTSGAPGHEPSPLNQMMAFIN